MKKWMMVSVLIFFVMVSCRFSAQAKTPQQVPSGGDGVEEIRGEFSYSNDIIDIYYVEPALALLDMTAFVMRDDQWELPVLSQVLGYMNIDSRAMKGTFHLSLPIQPLGMMNDVDQNSSQDSGVQIFALAYSPNLYGGPFSEGDDKTLGWPTYLASVKTDTENNDEVTGGQLIIWSPDDKQSFPSGFGADQMLFTADDPVVTVPAGYSIVDLDQNPFVIRREAQSAMTLYEPDDIAIKDYSQKSYQDAFNSMFEMIKKEYAFNGIEGKQPDWDALYQQVSPLVEKAEKDQDSTQYYLALETFVNAFKDGHVGLNGGSIGDQLFAQRAGGGVGLAVRELDDRRVLVVHVTEGGPAEAAGIQPGAEILTVEDRPVTAALDATEPLFGPYSTDFGRRYDQALFLFRGELDRPVKFTYKNPGASQPQEAALTRVREFDSLLATYGGASGEEVIPVNSAVLGGQVGYININSNYDDLNLILRLFERALKKFEKVGVKGIIIDMRQNSGGADLGLAGFLYNKEIPMAQLEYYSSLTGKFEPDGEREKVLPSKNQYHFDKMVLLVGLRCYSACEIESYAFSQVPGMQVVGEYPTGGVEAEVARGQFKLPEGFTVQVPTGRFTLADGSIFLEGKGVQPVIKVPVTEAGVLSGSDTVLEEAIRIIVGQ